MRLCRFNDNRLGLVENDMIKDVSEVLEQLPAFRWPFPQGDVLIAHLERLRPQIDRLAAGATSYAMEEVKLLSPVANPGKIIAAPVNYRLHLDEARTDTAIHFGAQVKAIEEAGVFLKATSSVIGAGETVIADWTDRRIDHEIELAVVIGRQGFRISEADALSYVAGYMIGLDMTIRGPEERSYRKSLDTFTVLGPWLVTADEIADPNALDFHLTVGGQPRQKANTRDLIFNVERLINYASKAYTLFPGDIIMTGTPEGVGPVVPGNVMHACIDAIGAMDVRVGGNRERP